MNEKTTNTFQNRVVGVFLKIQVSMLFHDELFEFIYSVNRC